MKILNRPMFRMGGPIKEGIMDGIQEPRRIGYATKGTVSVADQAKAFENIFTTPQVTQEQVTQFANRGTPNLNMGTPKISSFEKMKTNNQFGDQDPTIVPNITIKDKIESYTPNPENPFRDLIDYTKKINVYVDENGVKRDRTTGKEITDTDYSKVVTEPRGPQELGLTTRKEIKPDVKLPGDTDDTPLTKKERTNNILEMLGYDKAKKNALYDAMINAGQRISRTGLGADNLVSDIIQDTSTVYDKPEKLREAANLMDVQQQLKLDQIGASKDTRSPIQKNAEYFLQEGIVDNKKDAILMAQGKATDAAGIFFEASQKMNASQALNQTALILGQKEDFGKGVEFKNKIKKEYRGKPLSDFIKSDDFRGDGIYTADGKIIVIQDGEIKNELIIRGSTEDKLFSFGGED
mgnify:FL=1